MYKKCLICKKEKTLDNFYKITKKDKIYYQSYCKPCHLKANSLNPKRRESSIKSAHDYQIKTRNKILLFLGNKCSRCGFDDPRALQIDHINGHGSKDRKNRGWSKRYKDILCGKDTSFQLLCANCNWIKRVEERETHHGYASRG